MKEITIIGAGFSGLTLARALLKRNVRVTILERSARTGGMIETLQTPQGLVERAAPSLTQTDRFAEMLKDIGVTIETPAKAAKKRLFFVDRLTSWPLSVAQSLNLFFSFLKSKLGGSLKPHSGETLADWGRRCLTIPATQNLLAPALQGIYAGDAEKLSASLLLGNMFRKDREKFRGVIGIEGGMGRLIEALEKQILAMGGEIRKGQTVTSENLSRPCVLAVPPWEASVLLERVEPALAQRISRIQKSPIISVTAFFKEETGPKAFGCLVPRDRGLRVLGILLNHAIFPKRQGLASETWIFGGATDPKILNLSDADLKTTLLEERRRVFQKTDLPVEIILNRWPEGLPHYDLLLEDILKDLPQPKGIWLHGNWLGGIGLSKILERSDRLAEKIAAELA